MATEVSSLPYFISDDFSYLIEYDYRGKRLRLNHASDGSLIGELPREAISVSDTLDERRNARNAYTQVSIHSHTRVITYNKELNIRSVWPVERCKKQRPNIMDLDYISHDEFDHKLVLKDARCFVYHPMF